MPLRDRIPAIGSISLIVGWFYWEFGKFLAWLCGFKWWDGFQ